MMKFGFKPQVCLNFSLIFIYLYLPRVLHPPSYIIISNKKWGICIYKVIFLSWESYLKFKYTQ